MKTRLLAVAAALFIGLPVASSSAYVSISVGIAPPALPYYVQPACPTPGYIWVPGYWAYADFGYYWVPGVWVAPPRVGLYWTPGYWGYNGGSYMFNSGYWGPRVGFYGGINYGYGYFGSGYHGGEWAGGIFRYNTAVTRVNRTVIKNVYVNKTVINNYGNPRPRGASFNGPGGVKAQRRAEREAIADAEKVPPTQEQTKVREVAAKNPEFHASKNKGKPKVAAVKTPDEIEKITPAGDDAADKAGRKGKGRGQQADAGDESQPGDAAGAADDATDKAGRKGKGRGQQAATGDDAQPGDAADAGDGADADKPDRQGKGNRAAKAGDDAAQAGADDVADAADADRPGKRNNRKAREEQQQETADAGPAQSERATRKASRITNDDAPAPQQNVRAGKARRQAAQGMPDQATTPRLQNAPQRRSRAAEAMNNRGPQNRVERGLQRPQRQVQPQPARVTRQRAERPAAKEPAKKRKRGRDDG